MYTECLMKNGKSETRNSYGCQLEARHSNEDFWQSSQSRQRNQIKRSKTTTRQNIDSNVILKSEMTVFTRLSTLVRCSAVFEDASRCGTHCGGPALNQLKAEKEMLCLPRNRTAQCPRPRIGREGAAGAHRLPGTADL